MITALSTQLTPALYADYKTAGIISKGMIPKLDNAFNALKKGRFKGYYLPCR